MLLSQVLKRRQKKAAAYEYRPDASSESACSHGLRLYASHVWAAQATPTCFMTPDEPQSSRPSAT